MSPSQPSSVRVTVYARSMVPFPWAGRTWTNEPTEVDVCPNMARDLLVAPTHQLSVIWPKDYTAPDGSHPGAIEIPKELEHDSTTPAARITQLTLEANRAKSALQDAQADLGGLRIKVADLEKGIRSRDVELEVLSKKEPAHSADLERLLIIAKDDAEKAVRDQETAIRHLKAQHLGELDTLKSQHQIEVNSLCEEYTRQIARLNADLERATAPSARRK